MKMFLERTSSTKPFTFLCLSILFSFWLDMAAEEYNAFFYTLVSTVSPQATQDPTQTLV